MKFQTIFIFDLRLSLINFTFDQTRIPTPKSSQRCQSQQSKSNKILREGLEGLVLGFVLYSFGLQNISPKFIEKLWVVLDNPSFYSSEFMNINLLTITSIKCLCVSTFKVSIEYSGTLFWRILLWLEIYCGRDFLLLRLSQEMIDIPDLRHRALGGERTSEPFHWLIGEISKYWAQTLLGLVKWNLVMFTFLSGA